MVLLRCVASCCAGGSPGGQEVDTSRRELERGLDDDDALSDCGTRLRTIVSNQRE